MKILVLILAIVGLCALFCWAFEWILKWKTCRDVANNTALLMPLLKFWERFISAHVPVKGISLVFDLNNPDFVYVAYSVEYTPELFHDLNFDVGRTGKFGRYKVLLANVEKDSFNQIKVIFKVKGKEVLYANLCK